jgi:DNA-binding transcriptional LysR family regulator
MLSLDLNLLSVLVALEEQRSVSGAARKLERSQPAVSAALSKLRQFFDDPLFLRTGNSMQPTPRATAVIKSARSILERIDVEIVAPPKFDPASCDRPVRIALSDVGEVVFLPPILKKLRAAMPNADVYSVSLPAAGIQTEMESGEIDLAIGYFPDLRKRNFFQQTLFTDGFASLIRNDHPITAAKLTIKQFTQLEHAVVRAESRTEEVIERHLTSKKIQRRVVLTTPHFASAPIIVSQSDLVVTVPEPLARYFAGVTANLRVIALPFELPRIEMKQFWHRKVHHDDRNRWLRTMIYALFQTRRGNSSGKRH